MRFSRLGVLGVVVAVLAAGGFADRVRRDRPGPAGPSTEALLMPTAAPATALSSTWYCAGAVPAGAGTTATVVVANGRAREARGSLTVTTPRGARTVPLTVGPMAVAGVGVPELAQGPVAAVVDLDTGQATAEVVVAGPQEMEVVPCASAASDRWFFADGSTARDATLSLSLFNPFPEDAIADLSFTTEQGRAVPADFQGIVVPARGLVVRDIGEHVRRRESIATTMSVRTGRLVAAQTLVRTAPGRAGVSITLGSPAPSPVWYFPDGLVADGVGERYSLANPGRREARVLVELGLEEGEAEPFELIVPPLGRIALALNQESRVPKGVAHSTTVRSLNGEPVVALRTVEAVAPSPRSGRADTLGARRPATRWAFAAGGTSEQSDEWVVVQNPGTNPASVSFTGLAAGQALPLEGLQGVSIPPGRRRAFRIGDHVRRAPLPLLLRSTGPVVAERALYNVGRPGLSATVGIVL